MKNILRNILRRQDEGFSLVELLIAMTLLLVALIPMAALLISGLRASANVDVRMSARQLAASEISKVKDMDFKYVGMSGVALTFSAAANGNQIGPDAGSGLQATSTAAGPLNITFTITRNVTKLVKLVPGMSSYTATKLVTINVSWSSANPGGSGTVSGGSEPESTEIGPTGMAP
jgi:prepilin-type N-terminal cleavage/methylation domain-containing protein